MNRRSRWSRAQPASQWPSGRMRPDCRILQSRCRPAFHSTFGWDKAYPWVCRLHQGSTCTKPLSKNAGGPYTAASHCLGWAAMGAGGCHCKCGNPSGTPVPWLRPDAGRWTQLTVLPSLPPQRSIGDGSVLGRSYVLSFLSSIFSRLHFGPPQAADSRLVAGQNLIRLLCCSVIQPAARRGLPIVGHPRGYLRTGACLNCCMTRPPLKLSLEARPAVSVTPSCESTSGPPSSKRPNVASLWTETCRDMPRWLRLRCLTTLSTPQPPANP